MARHLHWCELRNLAPATVEQRRRALRRLEKAIGGRPEHGDETVLRAWWEALDLTPEGRATELSHVRQFYKWLVLEGERPDDPTARLIRPRIPRRLPRPIGQTDLDVALASAPERIRPWLMLATYAGLRAKEIAGLRAEDVTTDTDPAILFVAHGKADKQRIVPAHPMVLESLAGLPRRGYLFRLRDGRTGPVSPHLVSHLCNRFLHSIGIEATLHQCRHHFATAIYRISRDIRVAQELLGHASPTTTARYAAWSPSDGAAAVAALPSLPGGG